MKFATFVVQLSPNDKRLATACNLLLLTATGSSRTGTQRMARRDSARALVRIGHGGRVWSRG